jgi:hypothetical protein
VISWFYSLKKTARQVIIWEELEARNDFKKKVTITYTSRGDEYERYAKLTVANGLEKQLYGTSRGLKPNMTKAIYPSLWMIVGRKNDR